MQVRTLAAAILLFTLSCHGENTPTAPIFGAVTLTGKLTSATTAIPIERATVSVSQNGQIVNALSSSTGAYQFLNIIREGPVIVTARATGFETASATITLTAGSNRQDFALKPQ